MNRLFLVGCNCVFEPVLMGCNTCLLVCVILCLYMVDFLLGTALGVQPYMDVV